MLHQIFISIVSIAALACFGLAHAGEAGRVVFADADARVGGNAAVVGSAVNEGDQLQTGAKGYLYIKTVDNGFLILRPLSKARIVAYQIDKVNSANTRIKLEVDDGVARHISGEAVKNSRENFRLNTPVAAIGVRGTDFTVFTTNDTSRVTVSSGGIVVSPLSGTCEAAGRGPCEGAFSRELFASQVGVVLQVNRGQETPQILRGTNYFPDKIAPPRPDEPAIGKISGNIGAKASTDLDLTPIKSNSLEHFAEALPPDVPAVVAPVTKPLSWGRWEAVLGKGKEIDVVALLETHQLIATNAYYALLRSREGTWQRPEQNTLGFSLRDSQAAILDEKTRLVSAAGVENGTLQLDFAKATFATQFDLVSQNERFKLQSQGSISGDGRLDGNSQFARPTNMAVRGALNTDNASAAYLFQSRLDANRLASGVTYWSK